MAVERKLPGFCGSNETHRTACKVAHSFLNGATPAMRFNQTKHP
jgi:hypothetical protein